MILYLTLVDNHYLYASRFVERSIVALSNQLLIYIKRGECAVGGVTWSLGYVTLTAPRSGGIIT